MPVTPALRELRQAELCEFPAVLHRTLLADTIKPCLKKKKRLALSHLARVCCWTAQLPRNKVRV